MNYLSVCSGIEAATVAWHPLGWKPVAYSEIEKFPSAVLAHHYPDVPNLGDMTKFKEWPDAAIDVLVGGTPCQSFSVAGLRKGMDDPRGNLALTYLAIADRYRPKWLVWENVPGVLSSKKGRDFGSFLAGLAKLGYGFSYRILDAQYTRVSRFRRAVPQRRRRVFVVGCLGDWRSAAAVLFDSESLSGKPTPSRKSREEITFAVAPCLVSSGRGVERFGETRGQDPLVACYSATGAGTWRSGAGPLRSSGAGPYEVLLVHHGTCIMQGEPGVANTVRTPTGGGSVGMVLQNLRVRRLMPVECERLQGFPDDYTRIPWRNKPSDRCPDGPRYKAIGNSMAINCMSWIGERIELMETINQ